MKKFIAIVAALFVLCSCAWAADLVPGEEEAINGKRLFFEGEQEEAFAEFQKSADKGFPDGFSWIGLFYLDGIHVERDYDKGLELINKGIDLGSSDGLALLGMAYIEGKVQGVPQNIPLGIEYLEKAISVENPSGYAFFLVGVAYGEGLGEGRYSNIAYMQKALEMLEKAYALGFLPAEEEIGRIKGSIEIEEEIEMDKIMETVYSAKDLMQDVRSNQMRFDRNYSGKTFIISGYVGRIEEKGKQYAAQIFGEAGSGANPFNYIECRFEESQVDALLDLNRGSFVMVMGTYKGKQDFQSAEFVLFDCEIVK